MKQNSKNNSDDYMQKNDFNTGLINNIISFSITVDESNKKYNYGLSTIANNPSDTKSEGHLFYFILFSISECRRLIKFSPAIPFWL